MKRLELLERLALTSLRHHENTPGGETLEATFQTLGLEAQRSELGHGTTAVRHHERRSLTDLAEVGSKTGLELS